MFFGSDYTLLQGNKVVSMKALESEHKNSKSQVEYSKRNFGDIPTSETIYMAGGMAGEKASGSTELV